MDEKRRAGRPGEGYKNDRPRRTYQGVNLGKGRHRPDFKEEREQDETMLEGKNAVQEALSSGTEIDKILFSGGSLATVGSLVALARQKGIPAQEVDKRKLDRMSITGAHQGIIAFKAAVAYSTVEDMLKRAEEAGHPPLLVGGYEILQDGSALYRARRTVGTCSRAYPFGVNTNPGHADIYCFIRLLFFGGVDAAQQILIAGRGKQPRSADKCDYFPLRTG